MNLFFAHKQFNSISNIQVGSKEVRARQYPWGVVQVMMVSSSPPKFVSP